MNVLKKSELHSLSISEIGSERRGYLCIKGPVSDNLSAVNVLTSPKKTAEICRKAILSDFFINLSQIGSWKVILSQILDFRTVNTFTAGGKYFCHNREILPLPIHMQLFKRLKTFCCFLIAFLESPLNFERFFFKMSLIA